MADKAIVVELNFASSGTFVVVFKRKILPDEIAYMPATITIEGSGTRPWTYTGKEGRDALSPFFDDSIQVPGIAFPTELFPIDVAPLLGPIMPRM